MSYPLIFGALHAGAALDPLLSGCIAGFSQYNGPIL
jgi:hypothetical protein